MELARLGERQRQIVTFDQVPPELIDATTAIEDKDFWSNPGFDLGGFISASIDTLRGQPRGGSTITQQLVRARLLPAEAFSGSVYDRKIREIIQSIRLTQAYPGVAGKETIITTYLNQNFYGNQSYGVAAAAKSYFNKDLKDLTLAQIAILAAIPQSPTQYDLVKNATQTCTIDITPDQTCPAANTVITVPQDSEIVIRRNKVLDLMETRSVLSGSKHTVAEYEAAKNDPVILSPQGAAPWKAAQFVWQVRHQLGSILCGADSADTCPEVDTGGYKIITTLDWNMQQTVEKWLYAAARVPHVVNAQRQLTALKIPAADQKWILALRGAGIFNAAAGIIDYRTGQVLAYGGSAAYYGSGDAKFQPQFDVLSDGFRQPGSSIKPLNYITGIDDGTMTAATMFMDVVTDFGTKKPYTPTQADGYERGPVRLREALEFSLNVPSIKAGLINGLDHVFQRMKDFGLQFQPGTVPVVSQSIGTLDVHPIDMIGAYGAIANGGVLMPREMIMSVKGPDGSVVYPASEATPVGKRVASAQASYIITDILAGNTVKTVNPYWVEVADPRERQGAAGRLQDRHDPGQQGRPRRRLSRSTGRPGGAGPRRRRLDGQFRCHAQHGKGQDVPHDVGATLVGDPDRGQPGHARREVQAAVGDRDGHRRRLQRPPSGPVHHQDDQGALHRRAPSRLGPMIFTWSSTSTRRPALLWQDGCTGPDGQGGVPRLQQRRAAIPVLAAVHAGMGSTGRQGSRRVGRPDEDADVLLLQQLLRAVRARPGAACSRPTEVCAPLPPPICDPGTSFDPLATPDPFGSPAPTPCIQPTPGPTGTPSPTATHNGGKPTPTPGPSVIPSLPPPAAPAASSAPRRRRRRAAPGRRIQRRRPRSRRSLAQADDRRPVATFAPPAGTDVTGQWMGRGRAADRVAESAGAHPVDDRDPCESRERRVLEIAIERIECLLDPGAPEIERRGDRPGSSTSDRLDRGRRRIWSCPRRTWSVAVPGHATGPSPASGSTRSSTGTRTRMPPDSSVAVRPSRSRAR